LANIKAFSASSVRPYGQHPSTAAREGSAFEKRDDRHGVLDEAEINIPLVPEARETPGGAVPAQRLLGAREVEIDDPTRPLVEPNTPLPHAIQDGAYVRLIL